MSQAYEGIGFEDISVVGGLGYAWESLSYRYFGVLFCTETLYRADIFGLCYVYGELHADVYHWALLCK